MTMVKTTAVAACAITAAAVLHAQTRIDLRTQASVVVDFGNATFTRPVRTGTVLPAICQTGELFFKSDAPAGANVYGCVGTNIWAAPATTTTTGAQLPDMSGQAGKSLWTDGISTSWKNITTGATGALALTQTGSEVSLDIVSAVIPQKTAANVFTGLNTFGFGIQLSPQTAPAIPENGRIWYDSTLHKFRCHQNGLTSDCISTGGGGSAQTIIGGSGIIITDGDGVNGNPTIAASADLLNLTTPRSAATALMGPSSGSPGVPSFRALTESDLPSSVALLSSANIYNALNRFNAGLQFTPQIAPENPENGRMWYDSAAGRFRVRENGQTVDLRSSSSSGGFEDPGANGIVVRDALNHSVGRTLVAGNGITITNGNGVDGNPTISGPTASTYAYLSNTFGAAATTGATITANEGRGELVTAVTNLSIAACTVSVTSAVDGAEVRVGVYHVDGTKVCSGTATLSGGSAQTADIPCAASVAAGSSYYLIAASSSGSISWDAKAFGSANVRFLTASSAMQPFVTIAGATFDATEAFTKVTATTAQPLIACHQ